eukprot:10567795-Heterocapsa_arctica.AAC.1
MKLLDTLRLDERSVQMLLTSVDNVYDVGNAIIALKIHYPPSKTVTAQTIGRGSAPTGHRQK